MKNHLSALVALAALAATGLVRADESGTEPLLQFSIAAPYEGAQTYAAKLYPDGRVVYHGEYNTAIEGDLVYWIGKADLDAIANTIRTSGLKSTATSEEVAAALQQNHLSQWVLRANIDGKPINLLWRFSTYFLPTPNDFTPLMRNIENNLGTRKLRCVVVTSKALATAQLCELSPCVVTIKKSHVSEDLCKEMDF